MIAAGLLLLALAQPTPTAAPAAPPAQSGFAPTGLSTEGQSLVATVMQRSIGEVERLERRERDLSEAVARAFEARPLEVEAIAKLFEETSAVRHEAQLAKGRATIEILRGLSPADRDIFVKAVVAPVSRRVTSRP